MALATSKRKFYKLLDNLSASSLEDSSHNSKPRRPTSLPATGALAVPLSTSASSSSPYSSDKAPLHTAKRSRMSSTSISTATAPPTIAARPDSRPLPSRTTTTVRILSSNFENRSLLNGNNSTSVRTSASASAGESSTNITTTTTTTTTVLRAAAYSPWSHEAFLARLKTFADVKAWSPKADDIGEVAWAMRGWVTVGRDEVGCRGCGERVVVRLDSGGGAGEESESERMGEEKWWEKEAEERLVERYEGLIVDGHELTCLWRKAGCKDDIYRISFADQNVWVKLLCQRYNSLIELSDVLPENITIPTVREDLNQESFEPEKMRSWLSDSLRLHLKKDETSLTQTPDPSSKIIEPKEEDINNVALIMALCGWTGQNQSGVKIATCDKCFSRVGLWLYKHGSGHTIDPVGLHRTHCPWQNAKPQSGLGRFEGLAGWEILNDVICASVNRSKRQKGLIVQTVDPERNEEETPKKSRDQIDQEDRVRESKLAKLRRALTGKKS